jgi:cell division protein FtsZ
VQGISDIITIPGIINRDFADVKTTMAGMGQAVMGTAVRSGANRAMEAAQAAMASPLLEEGAIDGARGILINITGSSALKLSEVNEASSLIQMAAHEDANIIFGAVLDEKMDDEIKITVIATGFRDQMPERRARMLNVEETPVVSVPVVASGTWLREPQPEPARAAARFMSEEDEMESVEEPILFASAAARVATKVTVAAPQAKGGTEHAQAVGQLTIGAADVMEAGPPDADAHAKPAPRDFASEFVEAPRAMIGAAEPAAAAAPLSISEMNEGPDRDLDVPTFLRRLQF